jgi:hypothetical protein
MSGKDRAIGLVMIWAAIVGGSSLAGLLTRLVLNHVRPILGSELWVRLVAAVLVASSMVGLYAALERLSRGFRNEQSLWDWMVALHRGEAG